MASEQHNCTSMDEWKAHNSCVQRKSVSILTTPINPLKNISDQSGALYSPLCHTARHRSPSRAHAVSFGHMVSLVVTGVSHMITPVLPELLQVTREAAGSKPPEALGCICSADWGPFSNLLHKFTAAQPHSHQLRLTLGFTQFYVDVKVT